MAIDLEEDHTILIVLIEMYAPIVLIVMKTLIQDILGMDMVLDMVVGMDLDMVPIALIVKNSLEIIITALNRLLLFFDLSPYPM